ncbi:MAG: TrmH family RNA methyltransferase [Acidobacteriota bacterium]
MVGLFRTIISSRRNPRLRAILELRDEAAVRRRRQAYMVEGIKLIQEALDAGASLETVVVSPALRSRPGGAALLAKLRAGTVPFLAVSDGVMEHLSDARTPQGALAVARLPQPGEDQPRPGTPLLVAWHVQDPGNLGALLRVVEACGAAGLVAAGAGADPYQPRAVRAAAGSLFRIRPRRFALSGPLLAWLDRQGYRLAAASPRRGIPAHRFPWNHRWAILVGGEGRGLPAQLLDRAERHLHVPMAGKVESLSVPVAGALILHAAMRWRNSSRRRTPPSGTRRPAPTGGRKPRSPRSPPGGG